MNLVDAPNLELLLGGLVILVALLFGIRQIIELNKAKESKASREIANCGWCGLLTDDENSCQKCGVVVCDKCAKRRKKSFSVLFWMTMIGFGGKGGSASKVNKIAKPICKKCNKKGNRSALIYLLVLFIIMICLDSYMRYFR
ncbi:MAG: hypothetical protein CL967_08930 [Euryarchaeota archaeon]|nr:hypothetical protein [Euryarchaeota archaeon]|tara:strand:+ start:425 stop:850 length:426 start_codon:yes stop_codon:yes gene_type:complete